MTETDILLATPIGPLRARFDAGGALTALALPRPDEPNPPDPPPLPDAALPLARQLAEYFAGRRTRFDLRIAPRGTEFQQSVWSALRAIAPGTTTSYGEVARRIGRPTATRAVAQACGANPIAIVVPCHRVIGADGSLTGFGGGLALKRRLLHLEGALAGLAKERQDKTSG